MRSQEERFSWENVIVDGFRVEYKIVETEESFEGKEDLFRGARPVYVTVTNNVPERVRNDVYKELSKRFPIKGEINYTRTT